MNDAFKVVVKNGVKINISANIPLLLKEWFHTDYQSWENSTFQVLEYFLNSKKSSLDIGAWVGATVLYSAKLSKKVYAFEPSPKALKVLLENVAVSPDKDKIVIIPAALTANRGTAVLHSKDLINSAATLTTNSNVSMDDSAIVNTVTIDCVEKDYNLDDINFIKMDIEGYENVVFPALEPLIKKNRISMLMSVHPWLMSENDIKTLLSRCRATFPYLYHIDMITSFSYPSHFVDEHGGFELIGTFDRL